LPEDVWGAFSGKAAITTVSGWRDLNSRPHGPEPTNVNQLFQFAKLQYKRNAESAVFFIALVIIGFHKGLSGCCVKKISFFEAYFEARGTVYFIWFSSEWNYIVKQCL
jgi:hypothetical protein